MKYLPFETLTYRTALSPTESFQRLQDHVEPKRTLSVNGFSWPKKPHKDYHGYLSNNSFEITRIIHYRNSFLPTIKGRIESDPNGSIIHITMQPMIFVLLFLGVWCSVAALMFFVLLAQAISSGIFEPWIFIPLGMLLFAYLMTTLAFKHESKRSKEDLARIFEAKLVERNT